METKAKHFSFKPAIECGAVKITLYTGSFFQLMPFWEGKPS